MTEQLLTAALAIAQLALLLALAPGVNGVIKRIKAILQGRHGPPVLQPYFDLVKLLRKDAVVSEHQISAFPTKNTPVYKVKFTRMNLVLAGGAYMG